MNITFKNDNDIIVYPLAKIISSAEGNQYLCLAQSVWWISSIIGLQQGLITHFDNLRIRLEIGQSNRQVSVMPRDIQEESRSNINQQHIHPDRISRVQDMSNDISNLDRDTLGEELLFQIGKSSKRFVQKSRKPRKGCARKTDLLTPTSSGKVLAKPLSKRQKNCLQTIPKDILCYGGL